MTNYRFFAGNVQIAKVGRFVENSNKLFGIDPANPPVWNGTQHVGYVEITRVIKYKSNPSKHECNAKCRNGSVRGVCECKCGGKNHGVGSTSFVCDAA